MVGTAHGVIRWRSEFGEQESDDTFSDVGLASLQVVSRYIGDLGRDHHDRANACHSLLKADHAIVPDLIAAIRAEAHADILVSLVEIIWQHRLPETVAALRQVLRTVLREPSPHH